MKIRVYDARIFHAQIFPSVILAEKMYTADTRIAFIAITIIKSEFKTNYLPILKPELSSCVLLQLASPLQPLLLSEEIYPLFWKKGTRQNK